MNFDIKTEQLSDSAYVISLAGEVDLYTAPEFKQQLLEVIAPGDAAAGKKLFVANCGGCHTLANAGTKGTTGPNLDDAFGPDKQQGFSVQTIRDVVRGQIAYAESDPGTGHPGMPPNLVNGTDA